ncbi:hypothetical protein [Dermacoccus nishinomiyaensis]|uniref:hypothetical protein n=1 Tax=Dermacoccus nishinomiyaensis TaxID=1274 RepID=UPI001F50A3C9|nr:hypothetical protein [Dermacoccus nishinomiyaensis]MCI0154999.1 hypothetical protein [Dermacoccus nishinomiyaensis]
MTPAVIIATLALLFTGTSFWWLHARTGRVRASDVTAYAGYLKNGHLTVRIPVLLYNSGARTRVVEELRLTCLTWATHEGNWQTFAATLKPTEDESDFATPYAIDGRKTSSKFVTFTFDYSGHLPEPKPTAMTLEARLDDSSTWHTLRHITLHLGHMHSPARYITYRNNPDLCPSDEEQTPAAWKTLHPNLEADW